MSLSKLIDVLRQIRGSGYPAAFLTPDGKRWVPRKVVHTQDITDKGDVMCTDVYLEEVK